MATEWKPDPKQGGEHIEARKLEVLEHMKKAAELALEMAIRSKYGQKMSTDIQTILD
jgi:hypothetical protein